MDRSSNPPLARILACASTSLFAVFLTTLLAATLPPKLLSPSWQIRFSESVINNGTIALVGYLVLALAAWIDPASLKLRARLKFIGRMAMVAALGFLLLVPLYPHASWKILVSSNQQKAQQLSEVSKRLADFNADLKAATSNDELQTAVQSFSGGRQRLPEQDLSLSTQALRERIHSRLAEREEVIRQELRPESLNYRPLIRSSLRIALSSLAFAFAFGSGAIHSSFMFTFIAPMAEIRIEDESYISNIQ